MINGVKYKYLKMIDRQLHVSVTRQAHADSLFRLIVSLLLTNVT